MRQLTHVFFQVDVVDTHGLLFAIHAHDFHAATQTERVVQLRDLVVLGRVRIKVVLTVKLGVVGNLAAQHQTRHHRVTNRLFIHRGQRTGITQADRAHMGIRTGTKGRAATAKHLRGSLQLDVRFKSDDNFVFHSYCLLQARGSSRALAALKSVISPKLGAINCTPTGLPALVVPAGMAIAQQPARFTPTVSTSER